MSERHWRPMTRRDIPAWAVLLAEAEVVDDTGEHFSAEDLEEELGEPTLDLAHDTWAVLEDERLVASGQVYGDSQVWQIDHLHCFGIVHPDYRRRGIGARLLAEELARAEQLHLQRHPGVPASISMRPYDHVTGAVALARAAGLHPERHWFDMQHDLPGDPPPGVRLGAELRLVPFSTDRDDEVRRAHNEAFRDHFGSTERDPASWKQWFTGGRSFRPELSFLVLAGADPDVAAADVAAAGHGAAAAGRAAAADGHGAAAADAVAGAHHEVAGYLLGYFYEADAVASGCREAWIGQVGTRPAWRGRGIASALLSRALSTYQEQGYQRTTLGVDSENGAGALRLYQRLGFEVSRSSTSWAREIPAGSATGDESGGARR